MAWGLVLYVEGAEGGVCAAKKRRHDRSFESCREASDATYKLVEIRRAPLNHLSEIYLTYVLMDKAREKFLYSEDFFISLERSALILFVSFI